MSVYWTSVEFDILDPSAYEDCVGGFVYLFLKARDVREAVVKIEAAIEEEGLRTTRIEFVAPYDEIPWDSEEEQMQYDLLANQAQESDDEIVWDEISAYESRDE